MVQWINHLLCEPVVVDLIPSFTDLSDDPSQNIPDKKRNAPHRTVQLSGRLQVIGQYSLYQCKGMSGTAALHIFSNQASKMR